MAKIRTLVAARAWRAAREAERQTLLGRIEALRNTAFWAELDLGASIAEGTRARYMLRTYICVQAHAKALSRSPLNEAYWREETQ